MKGPNYKIWGCHAFIEIVHDIMTRLALLCCRQSNSNSCLSSTPALFNGQTVNFTLKPQKVVESTTYVKKTNLEECY